ncbi:hypothetical protein AB0H71_12420 [Nocardia sp. NPDC050697]|uniref:hypothetical protein n=1 Tax=Nocardia sp. NPDC050697 TaxID=3155158 RepID=UPI0033E247B8
MIRKAARLMRRDAVCRRYHLATEGDPAHVITLPHVREAMIDELCPAFTEQRGR